MPVALEQLHDHIYENGGGESKLSITVHIMHRITQMRYQMKLDTYSFYLVYNSIICIPNMLNYIST